MMSKYSIKTRKEFMQQIMRFALVVFGLGAIGIPMVADYQLKMPEQKVRVEEWEQAVYVGEEFSVGNLAAYGSTGYSWGQLIEEKQPIEFVRSEVKDLNYPKAPREGTPPPATDYFFKATQPGDFTLRFIHIGPGLVPNNISGFKIIQVKAIAKKTKNEQTVNKKEYTVTWASKSITVVELKDINVAVGDKFKIPRSAEHCSFLSHVVPEYQGIELVGYSPAQPPSWIFNATKEPANQYMRENTYLRFMNIKYDQGKPVDVLGFKTVRARINISQPMPVAQKVRYQTLDEYKKEVSKMTNVQLIKAMVEDIDRLTEAAKCLPQKGIEQDVAYVRSPEYVRPRLDIINAEIAKRLGR